MLVLTRAVGETLVIGDDVTVKVLAVTAFGVRLGIEAPRHVEVHRSEIYRRLQLKRGDAEPGR